MLKNYTHGKRASSGFGRIVIQGCTNIGLMKQVWEQLMCGHAQPMRATERRQAGCGRVSIRATGVDRGKGAGEDAVHQGECDAIGG